MCSQPLAAPAPPQPSCPVHLGFSALNTGTQHNPLHTGVSAAPDPLIKYCIVLWVNNQRAGSNHIPTWLKYKFNATLNHGRTLRFQVYTLTFFIKTTVHFELLVKGLGGLSCIKDTPSPKHVCQSGEVVEIQHWHYLLQFMHSIILPLIFEWPMNMKYCDSSAPLRRITAWWSWSSCPPSSSWASSSSSVSQAASSSASRW